MDQKQPTNDAYPDALRQKRIPHGALKKCFYINKSAPTGIVENFKAPGPRRNRVSGWDAEVVRKDGQVLITTHQEQDFGDPLVTVYQAATDVLREIEAFAEQENLPALSKLDGSMMRGTGARIWHSIQLDYDSPNENGAPLPTIVVDVLGLLEYDLESVKDAFLALLRNAIKNAKVLSREGERSAGPMEAFLKQMIGMNGPSAAAAPAPVNTASNDAGQAASQTAADTWNCPSCGAKGNRHQFCPNCGRARPQKEETEPNPSTAPTPPFFSQPGMNNVADPAALLAIRTPHGRLVSCGYGSYANPNTAIQMWNGDSSYRITAERTDNGQILTVSDKPQGGCRTVTDYRPATDVFASLEAFLERENLAALAPLRPKAMMTGGIIQHSIALQYADPHEEETIDCIALEQYGLGKLAEALRSILQEAVRTATVIASKKTPIIHPQAQALRDTREPHGRLLGCVCRRNLTAKEGERVTFYTRTVTVAQSGGAETIATEEKGEFRNTNSAVYAASNSVLAAIEAFADKENLWALSQLRVQQGAGLFGMMAAPAAAPDVIELTFESLGPAGAPPVTKQIDIGLLSQNGLGYVTEELDAIVSNAIAAAKVLSKNEIVNERVQRLDALRQQREPHGALLSCAEGSGNPQSDSFYIYTLARHEDGLTLTKVEKGQYRNKITTVFRPAGDLLSPLAAMAEQENLASLAALENPDPYNTVTLTYAPASPGGPDIVKTIGVKALRANGIACLLSPISKTLFEGSNGATILSRFWDCQVCGKTGIEGNVCPDCGTRMDAVITKLHTAVPARKAAAPAPKAAPADPNGWTCPCCGEYVAGYKFCANCGTLKPKD